MNFKNIYIGNLIEAKVTESGIELSRLCNFLQCTEEDLRVMYESKSLDTEILLKWSKLLKYDFFRFYTQHLILYAPHTTMSKETKKLQLNLPKFRKNIYTREIIDFIIERISKKEMTKNEVMEKYRIPKTTLYKWIEKYGK